jgi:hypothetical protein
MLRACTIFYEYLRTAPEYIGRRPSAHEAAGKGGSASGSGSKNRSPELVWSARIVGKAGSLHEAGARFGPLQFRLGRHPGHDDDFRPPLLPDLPQL